MTLECSILAIARLLMLVRNTFMARILSKCCQRNLSFPTGIVYSLSSWSTWICTLNRDIGFFTLFYKTWDLIVGQNFQKAIITGLFIEYSACWCRCWKSWHTLRMFNLSIAKKEKSFNTLRKLGCWGKQIEFANSNRKSCINILNRFTCLSFCMNQRAKSIISLRCNWHKIPSI